MTEELLNQFLVENFAWSERKLYLTVMVKSIEDGLNFVNRFENLKHVETIE